MNRELRARMRYLVSHLAPYERRPAHIYDLLRGQGWSTLQIEACIRWGAVVSEVGPDGRRVLRLGTAAEEAERTARMRADKRDRDRRYDEKRGVQRKLFTEAKRDGKPLVNVRPNAPGRDVRSLRARCGLCQECGRPLANPTTPGLCIVCKDKKRRAA